MLARLATVALWMAAALQEVSLGAVSHSLSHSLTPRVVHTRLSPTQSLARPRLLCLRDRAWCTCRGYMWEMTRQEP